MPYDGFVMRRFLDYSYDKLLNSHIRNFYYKDKVLYFSFQNFDLKISLNPSYSYITFEKREIPSDAKKHYFVEYLRSKVKGGVIKNVEQIELERTFKFEVFKIDDVGNKHLYEIYIDIMGKHSNVILVENGIILDAYKRIKNRFRNIYPGEKFILYKSNKIIPLEDLSEDSFKNLDIDMKTREFIYKNIQGFSKITSDEVLFRANIDKNQVAKNCLERLIYHIKDVIEDFKKEKIYVYFENEKPIEISAIQLKHLGLNFKEFVNVDEAINEYFNWLESKSFINQRKKSLADIIVKNIVKLENTLDKINKEIEKNKHFEKYRKYGELLKAYFYQIKKGENKAILFDWEDNENVEVPLDTSKEPLENAKEYFKKYSKMKSKLEGLIKRKSVIEKELNYLYQLWYTIEDSESEEELEDIRKEMVSEGIIHEKKKRKKKEAASKPKKVEYKGYTIYIGKNNKQNDELVRNSSNNDYWFHVHEMPGAHVILKNNGKEISNDVIEYTAQLAAGYSKGKDSGKVPVDYTKIKYVRKTKGLKPGLVLYSNYKTIYVTPRRIKDV